MVYLLNGPNIYLVHKSYQKDVSIDQLANSAMVGWTRLHLLSIEKNTLRDVASWKNVYSIVPFNKR